MMPAIAGDDSEVPPITYQPVLHGVLPQPAKALMGRVFFLGVKLLPDTAVRQSLFGRRTSRQINHSLVYL
jgi:hypothetical protein